MRRIAFVLVCALAALGVCFAESAGSQGNAAFGEVCASISAHKITRGNFTQTKHIQKISRDIKSSGDFVVSADDGVLWNTQKPFRSSMAITRGGIVQTAANGRKSVVGAGSNATFEQVSSLMTALFNGDADALGRNFEIEFAGSAGSASSAGGWSAKLVPRDASVRSFVALIEMAGRDTIDAMTLHEPGGDFTKYEFSNQTFPAALSEGERAAFSAE